MSAPADTLTAAEPGAAPEPLPPEKSTAGGAM